MLGFIAVFAWLKRVLRLLRVIKWGGWRGPLNASLPPRTPLAAVTVMADCAQSQIKGARRSIATSPRWTRNEFARTRQTAKQSGRSRAVTIDVGTCHFHSKFVTGVYLFFIRFLSSELYQKKIAKDSEGSRWNVILEVVILRQISLTTVTTAIWNYPMW